MAKTATISMRVNPETKAEAEEIFSTFGMSLTEAINVFLHKAIMVGGLPFDVRQPRYGKATEAAMAEARGIMSGDIQAPTYDSVDDLLSLLDK